MPRWFPLIACVCLVAACSANDTPAPGGPNLLAMKDLMERVVDPPADAFWGASGSIVTAQGETRRVPADAAAWEAAANAAATLVEAAHLLTLPARRRDEGQWVAFSDLLGEAARAGLKAALSKDEKAMFETGGDIYVACRACHMRYMLGYSEQEAQAYVEQAARDSRRARVN